MNIEQKLEQLREEYKTATDERKAAIVLEAKTLKLGLNAKEYIPYYHKRDLATMVQQTLV